MSDKQDSMDMNGEDDAVQRLVILTGHRSDTETIKRVLKGLKELEV